MGKYFLIILYSSLLSCGGAISAFPTTLANDGALVSQSGNVFIYESGKFIRTGRLPDEFLPTNSPMARPTLIKYDGSTLIVTTKSRGLLLSRDKGISFQQVPVMLRPMDFDPQYQRPVTAIDPMGNFLAHKHNLLYLYENTVLPVPSDLGSGIVITSVCTVGDRVFVGSSVSGMYSAKLSAKFGKTAKLPKLKFTRNTAGLPYLKHSDKHYIFEEIQSIHQSKNGNVLVATGIRPGLFLRKPGQARFTEILKGSASAPSDIKSASISLEGSHFWVATNSHFLTATVTPAESDIQSISWNDITRTAPEQPLLISLRDKNRNLQVNHSFSQEQLKPEKRSRLQKATGKKLFYVSAYSYKKRQKKIKELLERGIYNGLVIDLKDDHGYVRYDSQVPFIKSVGAVRPLLNLKELTDYTKKNNFYLVARLVVFKDGVLYRKPGYAILDRITRSAWQGSPQEKWVDAYNPALAENYYVPLIQELTSLGVDEIQLDYIRFPSDGPVGRCYFPHKKEDLYKSEALENFLYRIRQSTDLPLGVDVYGYNGIYRAPGIIGQDIDIYGERADVVSPMLYSSHFGDRYLTDRPRNERAFTLLNHSLSRATHIAQGRYVVRPWLQAFPMKNGIWGYGKKYFLDQIAGSDKGGGNGFMFWGTFDHMLAVEKAVSSGGSNE